MVDGDRWLITLAGAGGEVPPTDEVGFLDYAASLDVAEIPAAITAGTPLTPAYRFARMANRWICYHRLRRWPQRLIAVGDAVCVLNPTALVSPRMIAKVLHRPSSPKSTEV